MPHLFCCASTQPYRPRTLDHEAKFTNFMTWAAFPKDASPEASDGNNANLSDFEPSYAVQLVRQINFGPLESKRYFIPLEGGDEAFIEVSEDDIVQANFQKLNSYKNFKCAEHGKFFELNLYQKQPADKHRQHAYAARPASSIDL